MRITAKGFGNAMLQLTPGRREGTRPYGYSEGTQDTLYVRARSVAAARVAADRTRAAILRADPTIELAITTIHITTPAGSVTISL